MSDTGCNCGCGGFHDDGNPNCRLYAEPLSPPAPSPTPVPEASGRPGLTLREAAIEAILIREQDTAFSVVARHIAALFTSLDAIPSAPPVPSEGERRAGGAALIAAERQRQVSVDGWTPAHDAEHTIGELVDAAVCYLHDIDAESPMIWPWPWDESWWKPSDDRIRNLVRAGALIAAEIDRIQRAADRGEPT